MIQPGRDYNYPTSSGNAPAGFLSKSFTFSGVHVSMLSIGIVLMLLIVFNHKRGR